MMNDRHISSHEEDDGILMNEGFREDNRVKETEISLIEDFISEVEQRMEYVKIFIPIVELLRKRKSEDKLVRLIPELCFLLFAYLIYEGKLRYRGITFQNIESFLHKALNRLVQRDFQQEELREFTIELLDAMQNEGRNFTLEFHSFKSNSLKEKFIKFIEIKQSDEGVLLYYITEQGVDFYLKTKEFPDETKITVNLLLFQRQMDKGAFNYAFETIKRLNMEVQKKKDKKYTLLEAMMYGQLDGGDAYNSYHKSIETQFSEESELFNASMRNVRDVYSDYIGKFNSGQITDKERKAFDLIKTIEKEVSIAQRLHTELLREAVNFTQEYDKVLGSRRKAIFTDRFSFQAEFEKIIMRNKEPEILKHIFEPLLRPKVRKSFNPLSILEPQRIARNRSDEEDIQEDEEKVDRVTLDMRITKRVRQNFVFYAIRLLVALDNPAKQVSLREFALRLAAEYSEECIHNGDFLSFIIELNRNKDMGKHEKIINILDVPRQMDEELKTIEEVLLFATRSLKGHASQFIKITVKSYPDEDIELVPGLKITNMVFEGEYSV